MRPIRSALPLAAALSLTLTGCISFGAKPPPTLLAVTPAQTLAPDAVLSGDPADALVVQVPTVPRSIAVLRVAVQVDPTNIAYLDKAQWADEPANLMQALLAETIRASGRLVLPEVATEGRATNFLTGQLRNFGYDAQTREAVVTFDAVRLSGGKVVRQRRFEARVPVSAPEPGPVGIAVNAAANQVAAAVAAWAG